MTVAETRARFCWADGDQVVLHAGNIGLKQGLEQVVEAARTAAERRDPVRFVLSGGGNQAGAIRAAAHDLPNVSFLGVQPDGIHASLLAAADVLLLSERATQIDMSLPSKLTSYFAAGRPIVAAIPPGGGSGREVERSGAGLVVPAGAPERLLEALARLRAEPALVAELAAAGPAYAAANTSAVACLARATALIDEIGA
jgi:glycosyltransferase involved in cell wall biosynthesis